MDTSSEINSLDSLVTSVVHEVVAETRRVFERPSCPEDVINPSKNILIVGEKYGKRAFNILTISPVKRSFYVRHGELFLWESDFTVPVFLLNGNPLPDRDYHVVDVDASVMMRVQAARNYRR